MTETILYIDDDESNLLVLEATCAGELDVLTATSGPEGLEILASREVAVLLVDQRMPGMTGVEVFEIAQREYPDVIRILITAYTDLDDAIEAINRGHIRRYLRKPWEPGELKAALHEGVEFYQTRKKIKELESRLLETERTYALGVVAAGVAHELRSPLTAMSMNLELATLHLDEIKTLLAGDEPVDPKEIEAVAGALESVQGAVSGASKIVDGLDLTHRRRDEEVASNIQETLELTLKFMRAAIMKQSRLEIEAHPVPLVQGSPRELGQVLVNLLINAVQALPERPREQNLIEIRLAPADEAQWAVLEVFDNGAGITAETLEKIFDPFFTTKTQGGTGLGLATSKKIIEQAGGVIEARSTVGEGTRFTVRLPAAVGGKASHD